MSSVDWTERFRELMDYVGLTDEDRQLIKDSGALIMDHAWSMNDFIYDHIMKFPEARKFFVTDDDEPDEPRLLANKQTMISWMRASSNAPLNDGFMRYLARISHMHINIPLHRPGLSPVPPRFIIGTISYYQTAIAELLHEHMSDPDLALRTSLAWNKWMMVSLDLLLADYLSHDEK